MPWQTWGRWQVYNTVARSLFSTFDYYPSTIGGSRFLETDMSVNVETSEHTMWSWVSAVCIALCMSHPHGRVRSCHIVPVNMLTYGSSCTAEQTLLASRRPDLRCCGAIVGSSQKVPCMYRGRSSRGAGGYALLTAAYAGVGLSCTGLGLPRASVRGVVRAGQVYMRWGFLIDGYRAECFLWELVVLARKIAVSAVVVFAQDAFLQAYLAVVVLMASIMVQLQVKPFQLPLLNFFETLSLTATLITQLACLMCVLASLCALFAPGVR